MGITQDYIDVDIYEDVPDKPGYVRVCGRKTVKQLYKEVTERLQGLELYDELDYFSIAIEFRSKSKREQDKVVPPCYRIVSFPVTGSSEGHYIHVVGLQSDGMIVGLFLGKTFLGYDHACAVSNALSQMLS